MSDPEKSQPSLLEAQIAAATAQIRDEMEIAGARLEAMHAAGNLWGSPPARDLEVEVRTTLSLACKAFSLLNDLQAAAAQTPGFHATDRQTLPSEQPPAPQETAAEPPNKVAAAADHLGDLVVVRIVAEAIVPDANAVEIEAEGRLLEQQLGNIAAEGNVQVDITTKEYLDPEQERRESILSKDLATLFSDLKLAWDENKVIRYKIITRLGDRHGITTLRDVLLHGEATLRKTPAFGSGCIDYLKNVIAKTELGLTLSENQLQMSEIIKICPTLDQLPAKFYYKDLAGKLGNLSVAEIMDMNRGVLANLLATDGKPDLGTAFNLQSQLPHIASTFAKAVADKATS